jgi:hypothetical protein
MNFPSDNKIHQALDDIAESNAKAIEEITSKVNWLRLSKMFWVVAIQLVAFVGLIIAVIKLALKI